MGILEAVTLLFIALKLIGFIDWSWWLVLSPLLVAVFFYILFFAGFITLGVASVSNKRGRKKR